MKEIAELNFLCQQDLDDKSINGCHLQIVRVVLPDLVKWFWAHGVNKEDVEDLFSKEYFTVIDWVCKQKKEVSFEFLFRVFKKVIYRRWGKMKKIKTIEIEDTEIAFSDEDQLVFDQDLRSVLLHHCIEILPDYLKRVIKNYLENDTTNALTRAKALGISLNDYYARKSHAMRELMVCLQGNPLWKDQFK